MPVQAAANLLRRLWLAKLASSVSGARTVQAPWQYNLTARSQVPRPQALGGEEHAASIRWRESCSLWNRRDPVPVRACEASRISTSPWPEADSPAFNHLVSQRRPHLFHQRRARNCRPVAPSRSPL